MVLPPRFELGFAASETAALSIELRERIFNVPIGQYNLYAAKWDQDQTKTPRMNRLRF